MPRTARRVVLAVFAALAPAAHVARAAVPLPGTQPGELVNWPLAQPRSCYRCHGDYDTTQTYEAWDTWAGTMMANASRDPLFWAALDVANQDRPDVGDLCLRCHTPHGWLGGRSTPTDGSALQGPPDIEGNDYEGVSCELCHRTHVNPSPPAGQQPFYTQNAQYWIDDQDGAPSMPPLRRGPYDDVLVTQHPWTQDALQGEARLCGLCHNVTNPLHNLKDELGADTGRQYPIERTYAEWTESDFADPASPSFATCQTCHMPAVQGYGCADENPLRPDVYRHDFAGANAWIPQVLRGEYPLLGRDAAFDYTAGKAREMLAGAALLAVASPPSVPPGGSLGFTTRVTNQTGHKLPTGYPEGRRMWLEVMVRDGDGTPLLASGIYDDATGTLLPDPLLKVYEAQAAISGIGPTFHFVLNDSYALDNRIPPLGFVPDVETRTWGYTYPDLGGGRLANWDDTMYGLTLPPALEYPVTIDVRLRYQTASREYVEFLRDQNTTSTRGQRAYDLWVQYGMSPPVDMVATRAVVWGPAGPLPPNDIGNTLLLVKDLPGDVRLHWTNAPIDASHAAATEYETWQAQDGAGPWNAAETGIPTSPTGSTETADPALLVPPSPLLYRIVSRNAAGTSPLP